MSWESWVIGFIAGLIVIALFLLIMAAIDS